MGERILSSSVEDKRTASMAARSFEDLLVWQKSHDFVLEIYKLTSLLPKEELFGLVFQTRRAAVSIPANIAKGSGGLVNKINFVFSILQKPRLKR